METYTYLSVVIECPYCYCTFCVLLASIIIIISLISTLVNAQLKSIY